MVLSRKSIVATVLGSLLLLLLLACSDGNESQRAAIHSLDSFVPAKGPVSSDGLQGTLITNDLGIGNNRVAFFVTSKTGFMNSAIASITAFHISESSIKRQRKETGVAVLRSWPNGRGSYVTELSFDEEGLWELEISLLNTESASQTLTLPVRVNEEFIAPTVGSRTKMSPNKTLSDVSSIGELTTGSLQDPDLYQLTIREAIQTKRPTVVAIESPAFCTSVICGPQSEILHHLNHSYGSRVNFIHVDVYDNPHEIKGDLGKALLSPIVLEWELPSVPWTFIIDGDGVIVARFEGFAPAIEIEEILLELLT